MVFKRWAGTVRVLEQAGRIAATAVQEWTGSEPRVQITVEFPARTSRFESLDDLDNLDPRDLADIENLSIEVGHTYRAGAVIEARSFYLAEALKVRVEGENLTNVEGLARQLEDQLRPREPIGPDWIKRDMGFGPAIASLPVIVAVAALFDWHPAAGIALAVVWVGVVLLAWYVGRTVPHLEILPSSGSPRWAQLRARLWAAVGALVLGVLASVIAALVVGN